MKPSYDVEIGKIIYNDKEIPLAGGSGELTATTDAEMEALLTQENLGRVVKFTGTSDTYETDTYYLIGE